jgi:hypothetical protein
MKEKSSDIGIRSYNPCVRVQCAITELTRLVTYRYFKEDIKTT